MKRFQILDKIISNIPYINKQLKLLNDCGYEPGHYYSPIPDLIEIKKREDTIFNKKQIELNGINLYNEKQLSLLKLFIPFYNEIPYDFKNEEHSNTRYKVKDAWYRYSDVIMLCCMLRHFKPKRIIEVGSGYSSAVMLDINEQFLEGETFMSFIEPYPERLKNLLRNDDHKNCEILESFIQEIDPAFFSCLGENDILFIDSSHVSKVGSDLNYIFFEILPILKPGVLIHFHDIYYPFEVPKHWIQDKKWFWNETYLLRAFLSYNSEFKIINFNSYLQQVYRDWFEINMPFCLKGEKDTGSIWLQKN